MALRRIVAALHQQTKPSAEAYEAAIDEAASGDAFSMALRLVGLAVEHGYALRMTNTATPHVVRAHCDCMAALRATTAVLRRSSSRCTCCCGGGSARIGGKISRRSSAAGAAG